MKVTLNIDDFALGNWKTTLAGILGAVVNVVIDYLMGKMDTKTFVLSFLFALIGYLAKDGDKTGTKASPR